MKKTTNYTKRLLALMMALMLICSAAVGTTSVSAQTAPAPITYIPGDITDDGVVDMLDAVAMFKHTSGDTEVPAVQQEKADYNRDGEIDMQDTMAVFRVASGEAKRKPAFTPPDEMELAVFELINVERAKAGVDPLVYVYASQELADIRVDEVNQYFSHTRPNGEICFSVYDEFDMSDQAVMSGGENIAWGHRSPEEVMAAWMNSTGHRDNILNPNFTGVIVGVQEDATYPGYYGWMQYFFY